MRDQRAFDFDGADAVDGDVEDVVRAPEHTDVSVLVFQSPVTSNGCGPDIRPEFGPIFTF
jgi:hypothetical protein